MRRYGCIDHRSLFLIAIVPQHASRSAGLCIQLLSRSAATHSLTLLRGVSVHCACHHQNKRARVLQLAPTLPELAGIRGFRVGASTLLLRRRPSSCFFCVLLFSSQLQFRLDGDEEGGHMRKGQHGQRGCDVTSCNWRGRQAAPWKFTPQGQKSFRSK